jgi:hypothetical protein
MVGAEGLRLISKDFLYRQREDVTVVSPGRYLFATRDSPRRLDHAAAARALCDVRAVHGGLHGPTAAPLLYHDLPCAQVTVPEHDARLPTETGPGAPAARPPAMPGWFTSSLASAPRGSGRPHRGEREDGVIARKKAKSPTWSGVG